MVNEKRLIDANTKPVLLSAKSSILLGMSKKGANISAPNWCGVRIVDIFKLLAVMASAIEDIWELSSRGISVPTEKGERENEDIYCWINYKKPRLCATVC